jgi:hypothetical protein
MGLFDVAGALFSHLPQTVDQKLDLYFHDYSFVPLMVQVSCLFRI